MSTDVHRLRDYRFTDSDGLLFDANVWIYLYGPGGPPKAKAPMVYSDGLRRIQSAGASVFVNVVVLSEFINRYARIDYDSYAEPGERYKDFRNSARFKSTAQAIASSVRAIVRDARRLDCSFSSMDIAQAITLFEGGGQDFNDQMIVESCKAGGLKLVTHDADFRGCGVPVITANRYLLI